MYTNIADITKKKSSEIPSRSWCFYANYTIPSKHDYSKLSSNVFQLCFLLNTLRQFRWIPLLCLVFRRVMDLNTWTSEGHLFFMIRCRYPHGSAADGPWTLIWNAVRAFFVGKGGVSRRASLQNNWVVVVAYPEKNQALLTIFIWEGKKKHMGSMPNAKMRVGSSEIR